MSQAIGVSRRRALCLLLSSTAIGSLLWRTALADNGSDGQFIDAHADDAGTLRCEPAPGNVMGHRLLSVTQPGAGALRCGWSAEGNRQPVK